MTASRVASNKIIKYFLYHLFLHIVDLQTIPEPSLLYTILKTRQRKEAD